MRGFLVGILAAIIGLAGGIFIFLHLGLLNPSAAHPPSKFEANEAMKFLDAAVARRAPRQSSPFPANDENLLAGLQIYRAHCALCHGDPANPRSAVGLALYPRAPQFLEDAPDMPENQNFYIIQNGVRWTGMPGWKNSLEKKEIWQVTAFLAYMDHLPPDVSREWKPSSSASSPTPSPKPKGAQGHE